MDKPNSKGLIKRRDFVRQAVALGGLAAIASLLEACAPAGLGTPTGAAAVSLKTTHTPTSTSSPTSSPTHLPGTTPTAGATSTLRPSPTASPAPTPTPEANAARVAFVKTRDRAEGVRRALGLLHLNPVRGNKVFLKPNFNSSDPAPGSTHGDVLRTLVGELWDMDARAITVADRSGMGNTRRAMEQMGIFSMAEELGFEVLVLNELGKEGWVMVESPDSHWSRGFPFARSCLEAESIVQTCCLKTHRFGGHFTMSLKNSVGLVAKNGPDGYNYMNELHASSHQRLMIAEVNAAYTPDLIVMDGVEAFVDGGPESGKRVQAEVVLAGTDRVALDAVGVALLRYFGTTPQVSRGPIFEQEQIARAVELGLGVAGPGEIQLLTDDAESEAYAAQIREILSAG